MSEPLVNDNAGEIVTANAVVQKMLLADTFSHWLGVETLEIAPRRSVIRMAVRAEMLNGMGSSHGGIVYSLADSAFSYATNGCGFVCVAIDCTVSYPAVVQSGDVITAVAVVESSSNKLQFCNVTVRNQHNVIVGHFRGTVYRTLKPHFPDQAQPTS